MQPKKEIHVVITWYAMHPTPAEIVEIHVGLGPSHAVLH